MGKYGRIRHFTDIEAWKIVRDIRKKFYEILKRLPEEEKYCLNPQIRRACMSSTANIAEGFGRFHYQENIQFCRQSRASMYELQDHLITCLDEGYIRENEYKELFSLLENGIKAINGYIRMLKSQKEMREEN
jgi:four helix bundle protein